MTSGIQLTYFGIAATVLCITLTFEGSRSSEHLGLWQLGYAVQAPAFAVLSGVAFCGSTVRFMHRRRMLYGVYTAGFFATAALCVASAFAEEHRAGEAFNLNELYGIPLLLLVFNPALIVILARWSFGLPALIQSRRSRQGFDVVPNEPVNEQVDQ